MFNLDKIIKNGQKIIFYEKVISKIFFMNQKWKCDEVKEFL